MLHTFKYRLILILLLNILAIFSPLINVPHALAYASMYVSPSKGNYTVGSLITARIYVNGGGQAINAAQATVAFSSNILEYQSFSTSSSIFTFWTSGPTATSSTVRFSGGLASPGYSGNSGRIISITWKAKKIGVASVAINNGEVLANDGVGTNIYSGGSGATFNIVQRSSGEQSALLPAVTSSTHPNQNNWYRSKNVTLSWYGGTGATGYSYAFNNSSSFNPSSSVSSAKTTAFNNVNDGIWYFHLRAKTASAYLSTVHYRVQIDSTSPKSFATFVDQEGGILDSKPKIVFATTDEVSGISKYEASIDNESPFVIISGSKLPSQRPGHHTINVKAFDKAGNTSDSSASFRVQGINPPDVVDWTRVVSIMDPIQFVGYAELGDTIYVYLNNNQVDKFLVKDKLLTDKGAGALGIFKLSGAGNQVAWNYSYTKLIIPGKHTFSFSRVDDNKAESERTQSFPVRIEAATIKILGLTIPMYYVLFALVIILIIFLIIIIYLLKKLHRIALKGHHKIKSVAKLMGGKIRFRKKNPADIDKEIQVEQTSINQGLKKEDSDIEHLD